MKKRSLISFIVCLTFWGIEVSPTPAQNRQFCKRGALVNPARESKKIRNPDFGFVFDIPANYTSETSRSDNITYILLYNPNEQALNACCKKNRQIGCDGYPSLVTVKIEPAKSDTRLLPEVRANERFENIKPTTIANQKALVSLLLIASTKLLFLLLVTNQPLNQLMNKLFTELYPHLLLLNNVTY